jgi:ribosomal protein S18 acetylase RimI-like enzyme
MRIERYDADRGALLPLFALADDSPTQVAAYLPLGEILVARDGELIVGHAQIVESGMPGEFELKSIAVIEGRQRAGIGRDLVAAVVVRCRERGGRRLIVSTATASVGTLRFYQRLGFRMYQIVQDAFGPSSGYPDGLLLDGIPLRDQAWLELDLGAKVGLGGERSR